MHLHGIITFLGISYYLTLFIEWLLVSVQGEHHCKNWFVPNLKEIFLHYLVLLHTKNEFSKYRELLFVTRIYVFASILKCTCQMIFAVFRNIFSVLPFIIFFSPSIQKIFFFSFRSNASKYKGNNTFLLSFRR